MSVNPGNIDPTARSSPNYRLLFAQCVARFVHFEKIIDNPRGVAKDMRIGYPIVIDNDDKIWRAFNNGYWPAFCFVDAQGHMGHHQFGEADYEQSEMTGNCTPRVRSAWSSTTKSSSTRRS